MGTIIGALVGGYYGALGAATAGGDWQTVAISGAIGAFVGAGTGFFDPTLGAGTLAFVGGVSAGLGDAVAQAISRYAHGKSICINFGSVIGSIAGGALGGALTVPLAVAAPALANSWQGAAIIVGLTSTPTPILALLGGNIWNYEIGR